MDAREVKADLDAAIKKRDAIQAELAGADAEPKLIEPGMSERYRAAVGQLIDGFADEETQAEAMRCIRSLIDKIVVRPNAAGDDLVVDLHGALATILGMRPSPDAYGSEARRPCAGLPSGLDRAHPGAALRQKAKGLAQAPVASASRASGLVHWDEAAGRRWFPVTGDEGMTAGAVIVVDYLQALDRQREKPPLADQVAALKAFAKHGNSLSFSLRRSTATMTLRRRHCRTSPMFVCRVGRIDTSVFGKACFLRDGGLIFGGTGIASWRSKDAAPWQTPVKAPPSPLTARSSFLGRSRAGRGKLGVA